MASRDGNEVIRAAASATQRGQRRRPPSPAQRKHRDEWGKTWGRIAHDDTERFRKEAA